MTDKFKQEMKDLRAAALEDECQEQEAEMAAIEGVDEIDALFPMDDEDAIIAELYNRG